MHIPILMVKIQIRYTLWLFHIAMGNGPFIDGLPIKNGGSFMIFPWRTVKQLNNQRRVNNLLTIGVII